MTKGNVLGDNGGACVKFVFHVVFRIEQNGLPPSLDSAVLCGAVLCSAVRSSLHFLCYLDTMYTRLFFYFVPIFIIFLSFPFVFHFV